VIQPRPELERFLKFSAVGVIGAVVDFGTFNLLKAALGMAEVPASIVSFLAAVTSNFFWNRVWTYRDSRSKSVPRQAAQFAAVSAVGLALRTPVLALLLGPASRAAARLLALAPWVPLQAETLGANLALAAAVVVVLFWNFFANRIWTYGDVGGMGRSSDPAAGTPPV
jgi:putative flippase GtrA